MIDQLVNFETALLANEKGFNIQCNNGYWFGSKYNKDGEEMSFLIAKEDFPSLRDRKSKYFEIGNPFIYRPTQSFLQRWLRKYDIHISIDIAHVQIKNNPRQGWDFALYNIENDVFIEGIGDGKVYYSYEEALEIALQEGLKLIK